MTLETIQVGTIGATITVTVTEGGVAKDISTATNLKLYMQAVGELSSKVFTPSFVTTGADGKVKYTTTAATDIHAAGVWQAQVYYEMGSFKGYTLPVEAFEAVDNLTIINGYATLAQLKAVDRLNISTTDTASDASLGGIITAVSRAIDLQCSRYFYKSTADETRYFSARETDRIRVGDIVSITALYTDTLAGDRTYPYTWATTDYDLSPYDAAVLSEPQPYNWIEVSPLGQYLFPVGVAKGVKITGVFGWSAVPSAITEACLLWSERFFKRYKTPLGVSAMTALGEMNMKVPPPDPDVFMLLNNYRVITI